MRVHLIENGLVVNTIEVENIADFPGAIEATEGGIGWIYSNGILTPPESQTIVNERLTPRQIRMALTRSGLRETVEAAVKAGSQDLKDWWEFSTVFERNHPQVLAMAQALNVDEALLDEVWNLGAEL